MLLRHISLEFFSGGPDHLPDTNLNLESLEDELQWVVADVSVEPDDVILKDSEEMHIQAVNVN